MRGAVVFTHVFFPTLIHVRHSSKDLSVRVAVQKHVKHPEDSKPTHFMFSPGESGRVSYIPERNPLGFYSIS